MFLHYADMLADHRGAVQRIAEFLEHPVSDGDLDRIVERTSFAAAKKQAIAADEDPDPDRPAFFEGGQTSFIFKGTNGRWKDVLTSDDLALYEAAKARVLTDDCARWLEHGGPVPAAG
jgi:aryl sulfotransferase